jgi:heme A synthase
MKTAFTYAAGMAIAGALTTFIFFFAGYHDAPEKFGTAQTLQTILAILITVVGLILGLRARRAELPAHEAFTYGRALGTGTLIAVFAAALGAFFQFCYAAFINPGLRDVMVEAQIIKMEDQNVPAAHIEAAEKMMHFMMSPGMSAVMGLFFGFFFTFVLALIIAAFLKRPAQVETPPPLA